MHSLLLQANCAQKRLLHLWHVSRHLWELKAERLCKYCEVFKGEHHKGDLEVLMPVNELIVHYKTNFVFVGWK